MDQLLQARADVNVKDEGGMTPLDMANAEEVEAVLRQHGGKHSLFGAGHGSVVDQLLQGRADVNVKHKCQMAPLHYAAAKGHGSVVDQLLQARADVNIKDQWGKTPLDLANEKRHTEVAARLLKAAGGGAKSSSCWQQ